MVKENAIVQLGIKGADIVLATLKKTNDAKAKFSKPAKVALMTTSGGKPIGTTTAHVSESKAATEESKLANAAQKARQSLDHLASGFSSLSPASFLQSATTAMASLVPVLGDSISKFSGFAINAASGSLDAVKNSLSTTIDTQEKRGRGQYLGGAVELGSQLTTKQESRASELYHTPMENEENPTKNDIALRNELHELQSKMSGLRLQEQSAAIESIASKFGKFTGSNLEKVVRTMFANRPDVKQATAVASGNFQSLGTDKGFFMQKIADSFGSLPPSIAQEMQAQLLGSLNLKKGGDLMEDFAQGSRAASKVFDDSNRSLQQNLSALSADVIPLNRQFNELTQTMVTQGSRLTGVMATLASTINEAISSINEYLPASKAR